jgi:GTP-binding protein
VTPEDIRLRKRWLTINERKQHRNDNKKVVTK